MRPFSVLGAIVIVAVVCIACAALLSAKDRPVIHDGGWDEDADQGYGDEGMNQETTVFMTVGGRTFAIALEDNETAAAFADLLPLDIRMSELNGNEKYHYLTEELPSNDILSRVVHAGDVMLYSGDCLVVFYETFSTSYRYTPIGHVCDTEGFIEALGNGSVDVSFSITQTCFR